MNSFPSAKIIPLFYLIIGLIFLFFPEISQLSLSFNNKNLIATTFTREIGVLFIVIGILIWRIFSISKSVYRLMNSTFIVTMLLLSTIGPMMYILLPTNPPQLLITSVINIAFAFIYLWERKQ
jgi:multisubunit Na+/H+ antiporter MnhG subunit